MYPFFSSQGGSGPGEDGGWWGEGGGQMVAEKVQKAMMLYLMLFMNPPYPRIPIVRLRTLSQNHPFKHQHPNLPMTSLLVPPIVQLSSPTEPHPFPSLKSGEYSMGRSSKTPFLKQLHPNLISLQLSSQAEIQKPYTDRRTPSSRSLGTRSMFTSLRSANVRLI